MDSMLWRTIQTSTACTSSALPILTRMCLSGAVSHRFSQQCSYRMAPTPVDLLGSPSSCRSPCLRTSNTFSPTMDATNLLSTPTDQSTDHPSSPLSATHALISSLSLQPGMGLPFELWNHIVGFLDSHPYALLSCCLTCKRFREHARRRLQRLSHPTIYLYNLAAFNQFVEEVRTIPGRARPISELYLNSGFKPPLAFSLVPLRLATQLVNLQTLQLNFFNGAPKVPSYTWFLYGRAFPNVVYLDFVGFQFPSFIFFIRFITSFRALKRLDLANVSCAHSGVLPRSLWSPHNLDRLEQLGLRSMTDDGGQFLGQFIHWFSLRPGVVQRLHIHPLILSHPSGFLLLESTHRNLQHLTLNFVYFSPTEGFQKTWDRFIGK